MLIGIERKTLSALLENIRRCFLCEFFFATFGTNLDLIFIIYTCRVILSTHTEFHRI